MVRVAFTPNLRRHLPCPTVEAKGATVAEALGDVFAVHPRLRSYVLDDQFRLRRHVVIYLNSQKTGLDAPLAEGDEVYVMQALSGG
jgi:molybdopterin synthase sulfur carrier subunit